VKFRQPGDTAAPGMDYQLRAKLAFVTAGAHGIAEAIRAAAPDLLVAQSQVSVPKLIPRMFL
jgi:hypothetical protein